VVTSGRLPERAVAGRTVIRGSTLSHGRESNGTQSSEADPYGRTEAPEPLTRTEGRR
jgi:hypothetical protein